jgi:hypothetical protein
VTPTPSPTPTGNPCPTQLTIEGQGQQADLDTGWTGIALDQTVVGKGTITVGLDCPGSQRGSCGDCTVSGPIANATSTNNERCTSDTSVECTNGTPSGACSGSCAFFFGAPLPLSSGGVPVCVQNRVNGQITGTANPDTGAGSSQVSLISSVFTGLLIDRPCPVCSGTSFGSTGTCSDGPRAGQPCTVDGTSQFFGNTSFDCPPNPGANIGNLTIALNPTTGTSELTVSDSTACDTFPFTGRPCFCQGQDQFNACTDAVCTADANGVGTCEAGPPSGFCQPGEPFRSCNTNADCTGSDTCVFELRKCQGASQATPTLDITGPIRRTGTANPNSPVLVSTFCIAAVSAPAVNAAAGLPGPGALRLPSKTCYDASCTFP